jgi:hypothetical protein
MRFLTLVAFLLVPSLAVADSDRYVSLEISQTDVDWDGFKIISGGGLDETGDGFAITYGQYLGEDLALELSYIDGGSFSMAQSAGDRFLLDGIEYYWINDVAIEFEMSALSASLKYDFVKEANYKVYGRFGFFEGDMDYAGTVNGSNDYSGNVLGLGLLYNLDGDTDFKLEYSEMSDDDVFTSLSFGLVFGF